MTHNDLTQFIHTLKTAAHWREVFGPYVGASDKQADDLHRDVKRLLKKVHPDRFGGVGALADLAHQASVLLLDWERRANDDLSPSTPPGGLFEVTVDGQVWEVCAGLAQGDVCDLYLARHAGGGTHEMRVLKGARDLANNDLLDFEARALHRLFAARDGLDVFEKYLPTWHAALKTSDGRRVNMLGLADGFVSIADVMRAYPSGVDDRTFAWMANRVLELLAWVHKQGVIHGAILPEHVLIHPRAHGAKLVDWCYASIGWQTAPISLQAISGPYRDWYPGEVFDHHPMGPALDLFMAGRTLAAVAGGDPLSGQLPSHYPREVRDLWRGCTLDDPDARFDDAFEVYERFRTVLRRVYGSPTYHPFRMP